MAIYHVGAMQLHSECIGSKRTLLLLKIYFHMTILFSGSLGGSREATPPYRQSISYNPPSVAEAINKPGVRSQSWSSEVPIMPPLSVEVEPTNMIGMIETF